MCNSIPAVWIFKTNFYIIRMVCHSERENNCIKMFDPPVFPRCFAKDYLVIKYQEGNLKH